MKTITKTVLILLATALVGYGTVVSVNKPNSDSSTSSSAKLIPAKSSDTLEAQLKASLVQHYGSYTENAESEFILASGGHTDTSPTAASFSTTNLQESAADESDRLKTDGQYIYTSSIQTSTIKIFKANKEQPNLVSELPVQTANKDAILSGLYLRADKNQLIALAGDRNFKSEIINAWFSTDYWSMRKTELFEIDITTPSSPKQLNKLTIDGQLISSRRIGSTLFIATRQTIDIPGLIKSPESHSDASHNRAKISQTSLDDMLPSYKLNGEQNDLFNADDCFYTGNQAARFSQHSIISLLTIDLDSVLLKPRGQCFIGNAETVYASANAIYLATTHHPYTHESSDVVYEGSPTTEIHKFTIESGQTDYVGSASIEGHLGWRQSQKSFRMSEEKGILRVLSYIGDQANSIDSPARLHTLKESTAHQELDVIATLPNAKRPEPLGKKGEQIYASRFMGDKGFLVTFRNTDPLYILDISDPYDPFIISALEVEGYSDYLQPVGENFLLGIGKDTVIQSSDDPFDAFRGAWDQGVKLSLIDISNPASPFEKEKLVFGKRGTETSVSASHHGLTTLLKNDTLQINLPVSLHETVMENYGSEKHPSDYYGWTQDALYRLNINLNSGEISQLKPIVATFKDKPEGAEYYFDTGWQHDRSVIVDDDVYYLKRDELFSSTDSQL